MDIGRVIETIIVEPLVEPVPTQVEEKEVPREPSLPTPSSR